MRERVGHFVFTSTIGADDPDGPRVFKNKKFVEDRLVLSGRRVSWKILSHSSARHALRMGGHSGTGQDKDELHCCPRRRGDGTSGSHQASVEPFGD